MNSAKTAIAMAFMSERPDFNWVSLLRFIPTFVPKRLVLE
jgi:hypothetical protein